MKKKKVIIPLFIIVSFIIILIIINALTDKNVSGKDTDTENSHIIQSNGSTNQLDNNGNIVFPVNVSVVRKGSLITWINTSGYAYPVQDNEIKSNINTQVVQLNVYDGMRVNKGTILFQLDDSEYKLELDRYKNELLKAQIEYNLQRTTPFAGNIETAKYKRELDSLKLILSKSEKLLDAHKISYDDLDRIKRDYETMLTLTSVKREDVIASMSGLSNAIVDYDKAKLNLSYTKLLSPIDGLISDCNISKGSYVTTGNLCMRVINISKIKLECEVTESDLVNINTGDPVEAEFIALPGRKFQGSVTQINPSIDLDKRTAKVTVLLSNPSLLIKPGMFASIKIGSHTFSDVIIIPHSALLLRENRTLVFTVENGLSIWKYITIGQSNDQYYMVKRGLKIGDTLIVGGNYNLAHQSRITITSMEKY